MIDYCKEFRGKKITVMGLGVLGRGVGDSEFLAECDADLTVTDLKTEFELRDSLKKLTIHKNIAYTLGEHRLEDFRGKDMILKSADVPLDSPYIREARKNNIPVEMSASLFAKTAHISIIGITGTRGKSTVTHLTYEILKKADISVLLGGNVRGVATLPLLMKIKDGSVALFELDSWQLQGFGESKLSPHIAVFTNFYPDHLNYYHGDLEQYFLDKAYIFEYQTKKDYLITTEEVLALARKYGYNPQGRIIIPEPLPSDWHLKIPGEHNHSNAAFSMEIAKILEIPKRTIKKAVENFNGLEGRLQYLKSVRGVKIYNDNNATTPDATIAALKTLDKNILLIMGGSDKGLDMSNLVREIPKHCKAVVLFKEKGTNRIKKDIFVLKGVHVVETEGLEETINKAFSLATRGDIVLYSPAFASFGMYFRNEFDRGEQFTNIVNKLK